LISNVHFLGESRAGEESSRSRSSAACITVMNALPRNDMSTDAFLANECVQRKAGMFSGKQSHRGKSQNPVAWVAFVEEMKRMKPTDKAALGAVSESPGRNESELRSGLDKKIRPKAEPVRSGRRQHGTTQTDRGGVSLRRGGRDSTVARACRATGETVFVPPRNWWSKVGRITGATGKAIEDETVAARLVVAERRGNARGAKGPCCT
jgi:hypothetical protein